MYVAPDPEDQHSDIIDDLSVYEKKTIGYIKYENTKMKNQVKIEYLTNNSFVHCALSLDTSTYQTIPIYLVSFSGGK